MDQICEGDELIVRLPKFGVPFAIKLRGGRSYLFPNLIRSRNMRANERWLGKKDGEPSHTFTDNQHYKNERLLASRSCDTIVQQVFLSANLEWKKKLVQMRLFLHLLSQGHCMIDFSLMQTLFKKLEIPNLPHKHWYEVFGWDMANPLHAMVDVKTKKSIASVDFFLINCDEVTSIDN